VLELRDRPGDRVVLVALTQWRKDENKRRAREAEFDRHVTKPPQPEILDGTIAEYAEKS
jgi:CheY-like chemotaxis protein